MAITSRQGPSDKLDKNKLVSGEDALTLDKKEILYCVGPGDVRELATTKSVNDLLTAVPELYDKLQMLVGELENETLLQGILGDIDANASSLVAHKAELSGKHITESGSNENGRYIKFDDGTMICNFISNEFEVTTPATGYYFTNIPNWTFPANFVSIPSINLSPISAHSVISARIGTMYTYGFSNSRMFSFQAALSCKYSSIAIGRWK